MLVHRCDNANCEREIGSGEDRFRFTIEQVREAYRPDFPVQVKATKDFCSWTCAGEWLAIHAAAEKIPLAI